MLDCQNLKGNTHILKHHFYIMAVNTHALTLRGHVCQIPTANVENVPILPGFVATHQNVVLFTDILNLELLNF